MATDTVVCFDLDGTLVHFDRADDRILAEAFDQHLDGTEQAHLDAYDEAFSGRSRNSMRTPTALAWRP